MAHQPQSSATPPRRTGLNSAHEVPRITGASESVVVDSNRKNRIYAALIGVRIISVFLVLFTEGWVQIALLVGGMLAPWIGVQIANNIRQVDGQSAEMLEPQLAAIEAIQHAALESSEQIVLVGDFIVEDPSDTPTAESSATPDVDDDNERDHDDTRP